MRILLFILIPFFSNAQIIIESVEDISKIERLGDQYIINGPDDPIEFFDFLANIEQIIEDRIKEISEEKLSDIELQIRDCLENHKLSTVKKFKIKELREYAVKFHDFTEQEANDLKEPELIERLQELY